MQLIKCVYKNIKTGEYLRYYSINNDILCDTKLIENAKTIEFNFNPTKDNISTNKKYIIIPYNQELRIIKLKHLNEIYI